MIEKNNITKKVNVKRWGFLNKFKQTIKFLKTISIDNLVYYDAKAFLILIDYIKRENKPIWQK